MNTKVQKKEEIVKVTTTASKNVSTMAPLLPPLTEEQLERIESFRDLDGHYEEGSRLLCAIKALEVAIQKLEGIADLPDLTIHDLKGLLEVLNIIAENSTIDAGKKYTSENTDAYKDFFRNRLEIQPVLKYVEISKILHSKMRVPQINLMTSNSPENNYLWIFNNKLLSSHYDSLSDFILETMHNFPEDKDSPSLIMLPCGKIIIWDYYMAHNWLAKGRITEEDFIKFCEEAYIKEYCS